MSLRINLSPPPLTALAECERQSLPLVWCVQAADCVHGSLLHFALPGVQRWGARQPVSLQPIHAAIGERSIRPDGKFPDLGLEKQLSN